MCMDDQQSGMGPGGTPTFASGPNEGRNNLLKMILGSGGISKTLGTLNPLAGTISQGVFPLLLSRLYK